MDMQVLVLLILTVWGNGFYVLGGPPLTTADNGQHVIVKTSVLDRLDMVETLLKAQDEKLTLQALRISDQEKLLHWHNTKVSGQERLLHHQSVKLAQQEEELHSQKVKLTEQVNIVHRQETEISSLKHIVQKQQVKLSQLDNSHHHQADELYNAKSFIQQQHIRLSEMDSVLLNQQANVINAKTKLQQPIVAPIRQESGLFQPKHQLSELSNKFSQQRVHQDQNSGIDVQRHNFVPNSPKQHVDTSGQYSMSSKDVESSASHSVVSRSDDGGPLEIVVSNLGQQVTRIDADIQALKTQSGIDIQSLKDITTQQAHDMQDARSSTFVHWGSSQCTNASDLVYSGVVGGSRYTQSGAATNYLCLTLSPVFSSHSVPSYESFLYGGEYQTFDSRAEKDPVCAVCRSSFSSTLMVPGTNVCPSGWHQHYAGFLMAGGYGHTAGSEYICVDSRLETSIKGDANEEGKLLYFTVTSCGSLPCGPYINNKIVTCAVCGK